MSLKPDGGTWSIKEQIVEDPATGLTLQFEVVPDSDAPFQLRIFGEALPFGNREILFGQSGKEAGGGTLLSGLCRPTWTNTAD